MLRYEQRQRVLAKLTNARNELEDALNMSAVTARYDPVVLPDANRKDLAMMVDGLERMVRQIEGSQ
jgi:hypothetical protein